MPETYEDDPGDVNTAPEAAEDDDEASDSFLEDDE